MTLNLNNLELPREARRDAERMAQKILLSDAKMEDLLNPLRHHHTGRGARRADQLLREYGNFRVQTVDQVLSSSALPVGEARTNLANDIEQRVSAVNKAFGNLACHAVAELTEPTPLPPDPMMAPGNIRLQSYGPAPASDISRGFVARVNGTANHFWNSVQSRIMNSARDRTDWRENLEDVDQCDYCDED